MGNQTTKVSSVNKNNNKYADGNDNEKKSRTNWTAGRTHNSFFSFFGMTGTFSVYRHSVRIMTSYVKLYWGNSQPISPNMSMFF
jgi:hypothetical protein